MPDKIKLLLEMLPDEEVDEIWLWLDGNPDAIHEMIAVLANSHPNVCQ